MSPITRVDESAAGSPGQAFNQLVDQRSLAEEILSKNPNRAKKHPFRLYIEKVIAESGVPATQETSAMASLICDGVAKLPFLPDNVTNVAIPPAKKMTEFDQQIEKTAQRAEIALDSAMVWTSAALKLSRTALELRRQDPDGSKGIAWVDKPVEPVKQGSLPAAWQSDVEDDGGEDTV
jgi:hypothetical protein